VAIHTWDWSNKKWAKILCEVGDFSPKSYVKLLFLWYYSGKLRIALPTDCTKALGLTSAVRSEIFLCRESSGTYNLGCDVTRVLATTRTG